MMEATTDSYLTQAVQHAATAAYLAEKASSEEWQIFNQLRRVAREGNDPSSPIEKPVKPRGGSAPDPEPADPPDNDSLPGDPPESQPDY